MKNLLTFVILTTLLSGCSNAGYKFMSTDNVSSGSGKELGTPEWMQAPTEDALIVLTRELAPPPDDPANIVPNQQSAWTFSSTTDEMTDEVSYSVHSPIVAGGDANIIIFCYGSLVVFDESMKEQHLIAVRFDKQPKQDIAVTRASINTVLHISNSVEFINNLKKYNTVKIRAYNWRSLPTLTTISLNGATKAINKLTAVCK